MPFFKSLRAQLPSRHRGGNSSKQRSGNGEANQQQKSSSATSSLKSNGSSSYHRNQQQQQQDNNHSNHNHQGYYKDENAAPTPQQLANNYYNNNNNSSNELYNNYSSSRASIISCSGNYADVPMYYTRQQLPQQQSYRTTKPTTISKSDELQQRMPAVPTTTTTEIVPQQPPRREASKLEFYCQLAHGSPTVLVSGFASLKELYEKIAQRFDLRPDDILFCTLNTHKINMSELVGGQIGLDDFIFAHTKGRPKEIELIKTDTALGLTLTDNGTGYVFIKRIAANSIMDRLGADVVGVGDHIEKINGRSVVGRRHYEVARLLKGVERGACLLLRLVEPMSRTGFGVIGPRHAGPRSRSKFACYGTGRETLRFRSDGYARIELVYEDEKTREQIEKINNALESYMGIYDSVLARRLWEIAQNKINSMDLAKAIECSMPDAYDFPDDFIFEVWRIAFKARSVR